jgi:mannose-6-phosphate isomerase-like protein (cupin superfamily)
MKEEVSMIHPQRPLVMLTLISALVFPSSSAFAQAAAEESVAYVPREQVAEALANSGLMADGLDYRIIGAHRNAGAGTPEAHRDVTDIYYIVDGEATLVTGGRLEGASERTPGEFFGGELIGGEERMVSAGDVVAIPPGIPHWYKDVPNEISYYLVKVVRSRE